MGQALIPLVFGGAKLLFSGGPAAAQTPVAASKGGLFGNALNGAVKAPNATLDFNALRNASNASVDIDPPRGGLLGDPAQEVMRANKGARLDAAKPIPNASYDFTAKPQPNASIDFTAKPQPNASIDFMAKPQPNAPADFEGANSLFASVPPGVKPAEAVRPPIPAPGPGAAYTGASSPEMDRYINRASGRPMSLDRSRESFGNDLYASNDGLPATGAASPLPASAPAAPQGLFADGAPLSQPGSPGLTPAPAGKPKTGLLGGLFGGLVDALPDMPTDVKSGLKGVQGKLRGTVQNPLFQAGMGLAAAGYDGSNPYLNILKNLGSLPQADEDAQNLRINLTKAQADAAERKQKAEFDAMLAQLMAQRAGGQDTSQTAKPGSRSSDRGATVTR
ncbi:MAG: hypothetical protein WC130_05750 [Kiritimatiellia bacterium]|jgi:hypothetical protein